MTGSIILLIISWELIVLRSYYLFLATWDSPPTDEAGHESFRKAFIKYIAARDVFVPTLTSKEASKRDDREKRTFALLKQPEMGQPPGYKLKPFQVGVSSPIEILGPISS